MNDAMNRNNLPRTSQINPALLAAGSACVLFANPVTAVELGEIQLQSSLGQPLRASIAFALAPNEQISDQCVYLNAAGPVQGLPAVSRATATINGQRIMLRGDIPLREPMMTLELAVNCPYTAKLKREYLLLLNPASLANDEAEQAAAVNNDATSAIATPTRDARRPVNIFVASQRSNVRRTSPVVAGSEYRVATGDTLSEIAARIADRKVGLWNAVNRIYDANPHAFLNDDVNQLVAGVTLNIPASVTDGQRVAAPASAPASRTRAYSGVAQSPAAPADAPQASPAPVATPAESPPATSAASNPPADTSAAAAPTVTEQPAVVTPTASESATVAAIDTAITAAASNAPAIQEPQQRTVSIPDTRIEQQQPIPVAAAENENARSSWLVWLGGTGIAIFLALLLFGRRLREKFGGAEMAPDLDETQVNDAVHGTFNPSPDSGIEVKEGHDADIDHAETAALEIDASGDAVFDTGDDIDVALDYSFASSGDHSDELDFVVDSDDTQEAELPTRVMPTTAEAASSEDDDYDMSMVLDVTKQDFQSPGRLSADLQAVEVDAAQKGPAKKGGPRDLTTEFDYRILEQDYEDELTATQALSREVEEAARDLQKRLADIEPDSSQITIAQDLEATAEITAEMPSRALDTGIEETLSLTVSEETDLTEALAASIDELDFDIDDDDETAVLGLDRNLHQHRSKTG